MAFRLVPRADPRAAMVRTSRDRTAPNLIEAVAELPGTGVTVTLSLRVHPGGEVRVISVTVQAMEGPMGAVTTRALRAVPLDRLARDALRQLERGPVTERPDVAPHAYTWPGAPEGTFMAEPPPAERRPSPAEMVGEAARIYREASATGSRAPTLAVASALNCSRSSASRLIRAARDRGLLDPAAGEPASPARVDPVANPPGPRHRGPDIFRDPAAPWPGRPPSARERRAGQPPTERKDT